MKKLFLSFVALTTLILSANAQDASLVVAPVDPKVILKKVEKTKLATEDPKKGLKASTWAKYSDALTDAALANTKFIFIGAEAKNIVTSMGNPTNANEIPVVKIGDKECKLYKYPAVDIYFTMDDKVHLFVETAPIVPNVIEERERVILKAISLDEKLKEKMVPMLGNIVQDYLTQMQCSFNMKKFNDALILAEKAAKLQENPLLNDPKVTESIYFAVVCAMQAQDYNAAKRNLNILISKDDLKDGETIYYLGVAEDKLGNTEEAKRILEGGVEKFPANQDMLKSLIDMYVRTNENPSKVIPYIKQAQSKDPNNSILFIVEGVTYEKLNQPKKSIEAYENAIKCDPKSFVAYYNIGYTHSIEADKLVEEFDKIDYTNKTAIDKKTKEIIAVRKDAIVALEKAFEINNSDPNAIKLLRSLYFVLRDTSAEMQAQFEKFDALNSSLPK